MLREGREFLKGHLTVLEPLAAGREWLAGRRLSQADLIAAGHLSVLDYFGEIAWASWPSLKLWYSKLKSRPCFRPLLGDRFPRALVRRPRLLRAGRAKAPSWRPIPASSSDSAPPSWASACAASPRPLSRGARANGWPISSMRAATATWAGWRRRWSAAPTPPP